MRRYNITFHGRRRDSIGKFYDQTVLCGGEDREGAIRAMGTWYEYNHIISVEHVSPLPGILMPVNEDSRQQPKSKAFRLLEERVHKLRTSPPKPAPLRIKRLEFCRFGNGGADVFYRGRHIGTVMPTVPVENLGYGIQSWSIPLRGE